MLISKFTKGDKDMEDFGRVIFKVDQVLEEKKISKNRLEKRSKSSKDLT